MLFTYQLTLWLKLPVPWTLALHCVVCPSATVDEVQNTLTDVTVGRTDTATVVVPNFVESGVDVAMMVAVPTPLGVKTPEPLIAPILVGLTDQMTEELKAPVPLTVGVQVDV
jgi:hypothetical protein